MDEQDEESKIQPKREQDVDRSEVYYKLLDLVNVAAKTGLNELESDLEELAGKSKDDWNALINWDIPDKYEVMRQDSILGGLRSRSIAPKDNL